MPNKNSLFLDELINSFEQAELKDPRQDYKVAHPLQTVVVSALLAFLCGAETWEDVEETLVANFKELSCLLHFPNGVPSHDTYSRVFAAMETNALEQWLTLWVEDVKAKTTREVLEKEVLAIDGKTLRRSFDPSKGKKPLHLVHVWSTQMGFLIGQVKTDSKSNEITAVLEVLDKMCVKGCVLSIDAIACQTEIARKTTEKEADYVLAVKENQPTLYEAIRETFDRKTPSEKWYSHQTVDSGKHGRDEQRSYFSTTVDSSNTLVSKWVGLKSIICVHHERLVKGVLSLEKRYFISSLEAEKIQLIANAVRGRWGIENSLHWVLDVVMREDECRKRKGNSAQNFAMIRRFGLNLLKQMQGKLEKKKSLRLLRKRCGWSMKFLLETAGI